MSESGWLYLLHLLMLWFLVFAQQWRIRQLNNSLNGFIAVIEQVFSTILGRTNQNDENDPNEEYHSADRDRAMHELSKLMPRLFDGLFVVAQLIHTKGE